MKLILMAALAMAAGCGTSEEADPHEIMACPDQNPEDPSQVSCERACAAPPADAPYRCSYSQPTPDGPVILQCSGFMSDGVIGCCAQDVYSAPIIRFFECL